MGALEFRPPVRVRAAEHEPLEIAALVEQARAVVEGRPDVAIPHWMIKFDGVGELEAPDPNPRPFNRIEYAYSRLARDAGTDIVLASPELTR